MRPVGNDQDPEAEAPETVLPAATIPPTTRLTPEPEVLPWRGNGNVIAAAGSFLVDLLERA